MPSVEREIFSIERFLGWLWGISGLKGLSSAVIPSLDSMEGLLASVNLEGSLCRRAGECQSATRQCTEFTTMNLIEHKSLWIPGMSTRNIIKHHPIHVLQLVVWLILVSITRQWIYSDISIPHLLTTPSTQTKTYAWLQKLLLHILCTCSLRPLQNTCLHNLIKCFNSI